MRAWWWFFWDDEAAGTPPPAPRALDDTSVVAVGRVRNADAQGRLRAVRSAKRSAEEA